MRHFSLFFVVTAAAASLTGCGQMGFSTSSAARGGIAVVDLDKVAAETGRDRQLAQSIELAQNSLNQSLQKTLESANEQLTAKKKAFGEDMSDDQRKELSQMENFAVQKLSQFKNQAQAELAQFRQKQVAAFRAELKPIAHDIAAKRGLSIVIPKNEGLLLSVDSGVDITDEVVKVLRATRPVNTTATADQATTEKKEAASKPQSAAKPSKATRAIASEGEVEERQ